MAIDPSLASRVRTALGGAGEVVERRMMGGLCLMLDGHMVCGVNGADLMMERHAELLRRPHARPMDFTGRPRPGGGALWLRGSV